MAQIINIDEGVFEGSVTCSCGNNIYRKINRGQKSKQGLLSIVTNAKCITCKKEHFFSKVKKGTIELFKIERRKVPRENSDKKS